MLAVSGIGSETFLDTGSEVPHDLLPVSKGGSAAHYEGKVLAERIVARIEGKGEESEAYDGKVMCFLETGRGQASQLVFDFKNPPVPPEPSRLYHYEKSLFNRAYWYLVPKGVV